MGINVLMIFTALNDLAQGSCCIRSQWARCFTYKWLVNIHLSILQRTLSSSESLHLYRSATGYFICYLCSSSMSWILTAKYCCIYIDSSKFLYLLAAAAIIYNYSNNQQQQQFSSSVADLFCQDQIHLHCHIHYHAKTFTVFMIERIYLYTLVYIHSLATLLGTHF